MTKRLLPTFLLTLAFLLSACGEKPAASSNPTTIHTPEPTEAPSIYETPSVNEYNPLTLNKFLAEYEPAAVYEDIYLKGQYLLICSDSIVSLYVLGEYTSSEQINSESIVRVEHSTVTDICFIKIYDKTGHCISIVLDSESADTALDELSSLLPR